MLSIIRPSTYQANLEQLQPDFYRYRQIEDELAADLIGRNILKLLKKAPSTYAKKQERENQMKSSQTSYEDQGKIFHSDSSISSICSSTSSSSSTSNSSSLMSSLSSLTEAVKKRKNRDVPKAEVVMPEGMMSRVVRDVVRMGEGELHGIRGCCLIIELLDGESTLRLGKIACDPSLPSSFHLRLQLCAGSPPVEAHGSHVLLNRLLGAPVHYIYIKPGYVIEKVKRKP